MNLEPCCNTAITSSWIESQIKSDKALRKELDESLQKLKVAMGEECHSSEREIACRKIQEAIMWLGMDLKRIGTPNPYPESKDPSSLKIEPTADGLKM